MTECTQSGADRYHKITCSAEAIDGLPVDIFLEAHRQRRVEVVLDLDATDTPLHGEQEGRFFRSEEAAPELGEGGAGLR